MKFALGSDIHGNLSALEAVLKDSKKEKVDKFICLGDIIGYFGNKQRECLDLIFEEKITCVKGNHEESLSNNNLLIYFNKEAQQSIRDLRKKLPKTIKNKILKFPYFYFNKYFVGVHASLPEPHLFGYTFDKRDKVADAFVHLRRFCIAMSNYENKENKSRGYDLAFVGHSHIPEVIEIHKERGLNDFKRRGECNLKILNNDYITIVNIGSVGQARDGNPDACYVIYDTKKRSIKHKRVKYIRNDENLTDSKFNFPKFFRNMFN